MFIVFSRLGRTYFTADQEAAASALVWACRARGDMAWLEFDRALSA